MIGEMKKYIGVKVVLAKLMTLGDYNKLQGWEMPADQQPETLGYLVEYTDGGRKNHPDFAGYISWCPIEQFENANRSIEGLTFGHAIEAAKLGKKIVRAGWNGKGMFVVHQKGYPAGIPCNKQTAEAWGLKEGDLFKCEPYLQIQMVNGSHSMWQPSINDCLAEDWRIVE